MLSHKGQKTSCLLTYSHIHSHQAILFKQSFYFGLRQAAWKQSVIQVSCKHFIHSSNTYSLGTNQVPDIVLDVENPLVFETCSLVLPGTHQRLWHVLAGSLHWVSPPYFFFFFFSALFIFIGIILSLAQVKINGEVFLLRREPNNLKSQHHKGSEIETLPCKEC